MAKGPVEGSRTTTRQRLRPGALWAEIRALSTSPARPLHAVAASLFVSIGVAVVVTGISILGTAVQRLDDPALTDAATGRPIAVTTLEWDSPTLLSIGTIGAGPVTWDSTTGALTADLVPARADLTVLDLPNLPEGAEFAQRPVVTLRTSVPALEDVPPERQESLALASLIFGQEGRLPVLTFSLDRTAEVPEHFVGRIVEVGSRLIYSDIAEVGPDLPGRLISIDEHQESSDVDIGFAEFDTAVSSTTDLLGKGALVIYDGGYMLGVDLETTTQDSFDNALGPLDAFVDPELINDVPSQNYLGASVSLTYDASALAIAFENGQIVLRDTALDTLRVSGLAPPELWLEPVPEMAVTVNTSPANLSLLGFSAEGTRVTFQDSFGQLTQAVVGDTEFRSTPRRPIGISGGPRFCNGICQGNAVLSNLSLVGVTTGLAIWDTRLQQGLGAFGSAIDPNSERLAWWSLGGLVSVFTPDNETTLNVFSGAGLADVAFEPVTGAVIALYGDGLAKRLRLSDLIQNEVLSLPPDIVPEFRFLPPTLPNDAAPPEALALSFPPDEAVTLVLWSRTATSEAIIRRYDRATGEPLDSGIAVGFGDMILPDRSSYLVSAPNSGEVHVRDARTGGTVLHVRFPDARVQLAPSNSGRELGVVSLGNQMWTIRLPPDSTASPPPTPTELVMERKDDNVAVPVPGGVAHNGLWLSENGDTLLVRSRLGQMYVARPVSFTEAGPDLSCCIYLRPILPGLVAIDATLSPDGDAAFVAGADNGIWRADLDNDTPRLLVHLPGPFRAMTLSPDGQRLAVAADGAHPQIINTDRADWMAKLLFVGQRPWTASRDLAQRYLPAIRPDLDLDVIVVATSLELDEMRDIFTALTELEIDVRLLTWADRFHAVVVPDQAGPQNLRTLLSHIRSASPDYLGAILHSRASLCAVAESNDTETLGTSFPILDCGALGDGQEINVETP